MRIQRPRILLLAVVMMLVATACSAGKDATQRPALTQQRLDVPAGLVVVDTATGVEGIDPSTGSVLFDPTVATGVPDWSSMITATPRPDGAATDLVTLDPRTGDPVSSISVRGALVVRAVSSDGTSVALMPSSPGASDPSMPVDRTSTTIVVAHPGAGSEMGPSTTYRLDGNFVPEAFSSNDHHLFMIEYLPAVDPVSYRVTQLLLRKGTVLPVFGRPKAPPVERMAGTRLQQILAPDDSQLYTLYTNQPPAYAKGYSEQDETGDRPVAFIHTLNLQHWWAYCLDLPAAFGPGPASDKAIAITPDGSRLYAIDVARGVVAVVDTESLSVVRTEHVPIGANGVGQAVAAVSGDGRTLFVGRGQELTEIDTSTFATTARWSLPAAATGLSASADAGWLYLTTTAGLSVLDAATGRVAWSMPVPGASGIEYVGGDTTGSV